MTMSNQSASEKAGLDEVEVGSNENRVAATP